MDRDTFSKFGTLFFILSALWAVFFYSDYGLFRTPEGWTVRRPNSAQKKTVVRFLTYETGPEQMALVSEIERRFEEENPDIDVQVEFNNQARDKIYVELASGTAPDTFYAVTDDLPRLAHKGAIERLNPWIEKDPEADLSIYFPKVVNSLQFPQNSGNVLKEGNLYAYPIHYSTDVLFYNEDAFKKAGIPLPDNDWTWEEMMDAGRKLTIRDGKGRVKQFGLFMPDLDATIRSNGGEVFNKDYTRCVINNPAALEAVNALRDMRFKENIAPNPAQVQETSSTQMFKLGQVSMLPGRTYMVVDFNKIKDFKYNVTLMPGMKRNVQRLAVGGVAMSKQSKVKEAAFRWARFYCSPEGGMQSLSKVKNCVTAVKEHAYSPDYFLQAPPTNCEVLVTSLEDAEITVPPIVNAAEYLNRIRTPKFDDMLRLKNANIAKMLKEYEDETNKLLATEPSAEEIAARAARPE